MSSFYDQASWLLVPSGIEEDVVFAQKPISGLGDLTFTRASDATYTDSTGVVRRSPYNLLTWSEDFTNAAWIKQEVTISSNVAIAPNGTQSADKITPSTLNTVHQIRMDSVVSASQCSFGVFAKADGYSTIEILDRISATDGAIFNLSNGTFTNKGSGIGKIENYGNGWYRCTVTANTTGIRIYVPSSSSIAGNGTSGVLLWGAQLVEGTSALDYFPTTNRQDVPRIDFRNADGTLSSCGRLLLEPQRTNSIRNSSMVGAVAGTPGTLPTNWTLANLTGLTQTVVGTGTENGLPYVDLRFNGTSTTTNFEIRLETSTQIAATNGQIWTFSPYVKVINGTFDSSAIGIIERNSSSGFIAFGSTPVVVTSTLQRFAFTRTLAGGATVAFAQPVILLNLTNGATYDFTIRIAAPQMELGNFASTWVPSTTSAVTRIADFASKTSVSSLIGQSQGTLFVEVNDAVLGNVFSGTGRRFLTISDNTLNNRIIVFKNASNDSIQFVVVNGGVEQASISTSTNQSGVKKIAAGYANNDFVLYVNGVQIGTDTSGTVPSCDRMALGYETTSNLSNPACPVAQAALFPTRLTNAQLAQLTTL